MIRESDVQWWLLEAQKHPGSAPQIIEELAKRLQELDTENEELRTEILRLRKRTPTAQPSATVQSLKQQVTSLQKALQRQDVGAPELILLADRLQVGRIPLSRAIRSADQQEPILGMRAALALQRIVAARPGNELLMMTNRARAHRLLAADVRELDANGRWPVQTNSIQLEEGERLTAAASCDQAPRIWTVVTRRGFVQRLVRAGMDRSIAHGQELLHHLDRRDAPIALVPGDQGDLVLVTRWGLATRFGQHTIETQGSLAFDLDPDDQVVGALAVSGEAAKPESEILIVTASGYGIRRALEQLPARAHPGGTAGRTLIQAQDVLDLFPYVHSKARVIFATYGGHLRIAEAKDAERHDRLARGSRLCDLDRDPAVAAVLVQ